MNKFVCEICETESPGFRWTDTNTIGACLICGAPYRLIHFNANVRMVGSKKPHSLSKNKWVPLIKKYWRECHRNVDPGAYNFPNSKYEVATDEDYKVCDEWMDEHKSEWPR